MTGGARPGDLERHRDYFRARAVAATVPGEAALWTQLADELDAYLTGGDGGDDDAPPLF